MPLGARNSRAPRAVRDRLRAPSSHLAIAELPHFYRRLEDDFAAKRSHGVGHLGIPGFVFGGPIKKNMDRYDVEYGWYVHELKDPALKPKYDNLRMQYHAKKRGCCG